MLEVYDIPAPQLTYSSDDLKSIECDHDYELRKETLSNGAVTFRDQCCKCGKRGKQVSTSQLTKELRDNAKPFDHTLKADGEERWAAAIRNIRLQPTFEYRSKWFSWYSEYLASPIWKHKASLVLKRAGNICEACGEESATQVHHLTYTNVGEEPLYDLVAVCYNCHFHRIHSRGLP